MRVLKRVAASLVAVATVVLAAVAVAPAASASTMGWVYISAPTWLGNCAGGQNGRVDGLFAAVGNTWSTNGADWGDDLVYAKVRLGENQQVSFEAHCNKWPGSWQTGVGQMIKPTRNGQTIWVGPAGVRY